MRLTKSGNLLKKLAVVAGVASAGVLMSLPATALESLVAQSGTTGGSPINPANPDAEGGEAFEETPSGQPLPQETAPDGTTNQMEMDDEGGTMMDESTGGGAGGVDETNPVNPVNPDAEGGDAFERDPSGQPLPEETTPGGTTNQMDDQGGTMMDESTGGGAGGVQQTNPVNPANPDAVGGEAFEDEPSNQPLPGTTGTDDLDDDFDGTEGTTTDDGVGGGAGGGAVRALW
jgi:hypothetical protein